MFSFNGFGYTAGDKTATDPLLDLLYKLDIKSAYGNSNVWVSKTSLFSSWTRPMSSANYKIGYSVPNSKISGSKSSP